MGEIHAFLRSFTQYDIDVSEILTKLNQQQTAHESSVVTIQNNVTDINNLRSDFQQVSLKNTQLTEEVNLLKSIVAKQAMDIDVLRRELTDQQTRSMRNNLLFHNVTESKDENCLQAVRDLLSKQGFKESYQIEQIHRLGAYDHAATKPRPIVARLLSYGHVQSILKFASTKDDLKVTPQFPAERRARRRQLYEISDAVRQGGTNARTKIVGDNLYINGKRHVDPLPKPTAQDLLFASEGDRREASEKSFHKATRKVEGSTFTVRAAAVNSIYDCRALYKMLLLDPNNASAMHNTAAYRFYNPLSSKSQDGYNDDGEHAMGRFVRDAIIELDGKNVIVFVTRHYTGGHLGPTRFRIVKDLIEKALKDLKTE